VARKGQTEGESGDSDQRAPRASNNNLGLAKESPQLGN